MQRAAEGNRKNVYRRFIDLSEIVMFLALIAIVVAVVAILAWDALRNSYVRFLEMVTRNGRSEGPE